MILKALLLPFPYSLGDAIDWKLNQATNGNDLLAIPLLARGRDRLETLVYTIRSDRCRHVSPTR